MAEFIDKMKDYLSKGVEVSKDALSKAGEKAQDLGEKGILKIEISQLENKAEKEFISLGKKVYELFITNGQQSLSADDGQISGVVGEITRLKNEVAKRFASMDSGKNGDASADNLEARNVTPEKE
ncbi:MAG: hypothetical protein LBU99_05850 [Spirochaetaceae bacterium]|jgi:hypothetical protein|nr:hypothetical protein [Spirochaetaceae bacterium]